MQNSFNGAVNEATIVGVKAGDLVDEKYELTVRHQNRKLGTLQIAGYNEDQLAVLQRFIDDKNELIGRKIKINPVADGDGQPFINWNIEITDEIDPAAQGIFRDRGLIGEQDPNLNGSARVTGFTGLGS